MSQNETSSQTAGPRNYGQTFQGLEAVTPTGTDAANDCVADMQGAVAITRPAFSDDGTQPGITPWTHFQSATLGSSFVCQRPGRWLVKAKVYTTGLGVIAAALSADAVAAELGAMTTTLSQTLIDCGEVGAHGSEDCIPLEGIVDVNESEQPVVRLLISNGAAGPPAAANLNVVDTFISFEWIGPGN